MAEREAWKRAWIRRSPEPSVGPSSTGGALRVVVDTRLFNAEQPDPAGGPCPFQIVYVLTRDKFRIRAWPLVESAPVWSLVIPVIARADEVVKQTASTRWDIAKAAGRLVVFADSAIDRVPSRRERVFNLVPGFEALPLEVVSNGAKAVNAHCKSSHDI